MSNRLNPGDQLSVNDSLESNQGGYVLILQGDGNLVLYEPGSVPVWATFTDGKPVDRAIMQGDGNFVLYDSSGHPHWSSGTHGNPGSVIILQDDRNLVIYAPGTRPIWASGTGDPHFIPEEEISNDNPILRQLLEKVVRENLAQHDSEGRAWFNEGKKREKITVAGITVGSITHETKTWLWLDSPSQHLNISFFRLVFPDGGVRFGLSASARVKFKAWGKIPNVVTADVKGSARTRIRIEGSANLAGDRLTNANIERLEGSISDVRFNNDLLAAIQGLIRDVLNGYIQHNMNDLKRDLEQVINDITF